jgi:hypothetical protein
MVGGGVIVGGEETAGGDETGGEESAEREETADVEEPVELGIDPILSPIGLSGAPFLLRLNSVELRRAVYLRREIYHSQYRVQ